MNNNWFCNQNHLIYLNFFISATKKMFLTYNKECFSKYVPIKIPTLIFWSCHCIYWALVVVVNNLANEHPVFSLLCISIRLFLCCGSGSTFFLANCPQKLDNFMLSTVFEFAKYKITLFFSWQVVLPESNRDTIISVWYDN